MTWLRAMDDKLAAERAMHLLNRKRCVWARREWSPSREDYIYVISDGRTAKSFVSTSWARCHQAYLHGS